MALTDKLNAIGNAIRQRTGKAEKLTLEAMPGEIEGIGPLQEKDYVMQEKGPVEIFPDAGFDGIQKITVEVGSDFLSANANDYYVNTVKPNLPNVCQALLKEGTVLNVNGKPIAQLAADGREIEGLYVDGQLLWRCAKLLPEGYIQLAAIKSGGSQYIDTQYTPTPSTNIEFDCTASGDGCLFGVRHDFGDSSDDRAFVSTLTQDSDTFIEWFRRPGYKASSYISGVKAVRAVRKFVGANYTIDYVDDTEIDPNPVFKTLTGDEQSFTCPDGHTLCLGCDNQYYQNETTGAWNHRYYNICKDLTIYGCKIFEGDSIVRKFVPCINPEGVAGLYDFVTCEFFGSVSADQFIPVEG